jgi:hypothetical protein
MVTLISLYARQSNIFNLERTHHSNVESNPKKLKVQNEQPIQQSIQQLTEQSIQQSIEQSSSSNAILSSEIENKIQEVVRNSMGDLTKMVTKIYKNQKKESNPAKVISHRIFSYNFMIAFSFMT